MVLTGQPIMVRWYTQVFVLFLENTLNWSKQYIFWGAEALCSIKSFCRRPHTFSPTGWCPRCTGWPSTRPAAAGQRYWRPPSGCWSPCSPPVPLSSPWWSGSYGSAAGWGVPRCGLENRGWLVNTVGYWSNMRATYRGSFYVMATPLFGRKHSLSFD